jgi:hypothetical protein
MPRYSWFSALVLTAGTILVGCGSDSPDATSSSNAGSATQKSEPTIAEFAVAADATCTRIGARFGSLPDPDGDGGAKPLGIGAFMHDAAAELRALEVPAPITRDWNKGLALFERAADKLTEFEQLAAAGDLERAGEAQGEALWSLESKAQEHFNAMHVPFRVCWVE